MKSVSINYTFKSVVNFKIIALTLILLSVLQVSSTKNGIRKIPKQEIEKSGLRLVINDEVINIVTPKIIPMINDKLANFTQVIPDQHMSFNLLILKAQIDITNIKFKLNNLTNDNSLIKFGEKNKLLVSLQNITGTGDGNGMLNLGPSHNKMDFKLFIDKLDINLELEISSIESKKEPGKRLPNINLINIEINIDIDFDISGGILAKMVDMIKYVVLKPITNLVKSKIPDMLPDVNTQIEKIISGLPVYFNVYKTFFLDLSLVSEPKVSKNNLIVNINGLIGDSNFPETMKSHYDLQELKLIPTTQGKQLQLFVTEYFVNTILYTIFTNGMAKIEVNSDLVKSLGVHVDTSLFDVIFNGFSDVYKKDTEVSLNCKLSDKLPLVKFDNSLFAANFLIKCDVLVNKSEVAMEFITNLNVEAKVSIQEKGIIHFELDYVQLNQSTMIQSNVPLADIGYFEQMIDKISNVAIPILNKKVLINLPHVPFDKIPIVNIQESVMYIQNNLLVIEVNPALL